MHYKNIVLLGTSHIAKQSIEEVKAAIEQHKPEIIAVELDSERAFALLEGKEGGPSLRHAFTLGWKGYAFAKLGHYAEKTLGKSVGVKPGAEMKKALQIAKEKNLTVMFIDQPIQKTLQRISETFTWKEKFRIVKDIIIGGGKALVGKQEIQFDLRKVPEEELIQKLIKEVQRRYPNLYKVLIEERNEYMAKKLFRIRAQYPDKKVLAIMGAGHAQEIVKLLHEKEKHSDIIYYSHKFSVEAS